MIKLGGKNYSWILLKESTIHCLLLIFVDSKLSMCVVTDCRPSIQFSGICNSKHLFFHAQIYGSVLAWLDSPGVRRAWLQAAGCFFGLLHMFLHSSWTSSLARICFSHGNGRGPREPPIGQSKSEAKG